MQILLRMNFFLVGGIAYSGAYSTFIRTFLLINFSIYCNPQTLLRPLFITFKKNKVFYVLIALFPFFFSNTWAIFSRQNTVLCVLYLHGCTLTFKHFSVDTSQSYPESFMLPGFL